MKNVILAAAIAATTSVCFGSDPVQGGPTGSLEVDRTVVRAGGTPTVSWNINFPPLLTETVDINGEPGGTTPVNTGAEIETKTRVQVEVYMIGTAVSNHHQATNTEINLGGSWLPVYRGFGRDIDSTTPVITQTVPAGTKIEVRSQVTAGNTIFGYLGAGVRYSSTSKNMLVMTDGATPDSRQGWGGDQSLEDYVRPYLAADGSFDLGESDIMIAAELTHSRARINEAGYDSNDSIVLVRFVNVD